MNTLNLNKLKALFEQALALPPAQRASFVNNVCKTRRTLRTELLLLLAAHDDASGYFDNLARALFAPAPACNFPKRVAQYFLLEQLGKGAMGIVYHAYDTRLDRCVALKFLSPHLSADDEARQRFLHEARAAASLDHPNIATVFEIGDTNGYLFIAMPCYQGETLKQKVVRGPLDMATATDLALQITDGLIYIHHQNMMHRDIKSTNIIVTKTPRLLARHGLAKIVDFGLAKITGTDMTKAGTTMGTVAYMSPEQASCKPLDPRTDLWSLGVVLYEMVTGGLPFDGDGEQAVIYKILNEDPVPVAERRTGIPSALQAILHKCLVKDPRLRYQTAAALRADLKRMRRGDGPSKRASRRPKPSAIPSLPALV